MFDRFKSDPIVTMFDRFKSDPTPEDRINRIEHTLETALSRRQDVREDLKERRRQTRRELSRAEKQLDGATGEHLAELRQHIDGKEDIIQEYQTRIETLTHQITAIRKRFPKLVVLRTDIELMRDLRDDTSWQENVDGLIRTLSTEDPVSGSADSQLHALLDEIDDMIDDTADTATTAPGVDDLGLGPETTDTSDESTQEDDTLSH